MDKVIGTITIIAAILVSSIASRYVFNRIRSNAAKSASSISHDNIIRQPRMYLYAGIGCCIGSIVLALLALLAPSEDPFSVRVVISIVFLGVGMLCALIILFQLNWRIEVGEDFFSYTNIWRKTATYEFCQISLRDTPSALDVIDKENKRILRISLLQGNISCLTVAYRKWEKTNKIKKQRPIKNLTYRYGTYARNFGIAFMTIGCIVCVLATLSTLSGEFAVPIIFFTLLGITLPAGIICLLLYKVWKIEIINDKFIFRNFLGITRTYELSEISEKNNAKTTEYFHGKKRIVRVWDYIVG